MLLTVVVKKLFLSFASGNRRQSNDLKLHSSEWHLQKWWNSWGFRVLKYESVHNYFTMIKAFIIAKTEYSIMITPHFIKLNYIFVKEQFRIPCQFLDRDSVISYQTSDQNVLSRYKTRQNFLKIFILNVHIKTV